MHVYSVTSDALQPHGLYVACQASLSMEFSRQEYLSGLPFPTPNQGIKLVSPVSPALAGKSLPPCHLGGSHVQFLSV